MATTGADAGGLRLADGRQAYRLRLLARHYRAQLEPVLAADLVWVETRGRLVEVVLRDGTRVQDDDDWIRASRGTEDAARVIAAMAVARGWKAVVTTGTGEFRAALWLELRRRGIDVADYQPPQGILRLWEEEARRRAAASAGLTRLPRAPAASPRAGSPPSNASPPPSHATGEAGSPPPPQGAAAASRAVGQSAPSPEEVRLLGRSEAEELARRRAGPVHRRLPAPPPADASPAACRRWWDGVVARIQDSMQRSEKAARPVLDEAAARSVLLSRAVEVAQTAAGDLDRVGRELREHRATAPPLLARLWRQDADVNTWRLNGRGLAERLAAARAEARQAQRALLEREGWLATAEGGQAVRDAIDRSRLYVELGELRRRDAAMERAGLERLQHEVLQNWTHRPDADLRPGRGPRLR